MSHFHLTSTNCFLNNFFLYNLNASILLDKLNFNWPGSIYKIYYCLFLHMSNTIHPILGHGRGTQSFLEPLARYLQRLETKFSSHFTSMLNYSLWNFHHFRVPRRSKSQAISNNLMILSDRLLDSWKLSNLPLYYAAIHSQGASQQYTEAAA